VKVYFICIAVGKNSCVGKILGKLEQAIETTPLQMKLEKIATDIGKLGMYCGTLDDPYPLPKILH
jgi:magnesium-transporting ATPase (P-type)